MKGTPQALLDTLIAHGLVPDGLGELHGLSFKQAAAIRASGWSCQPIAGRPWRAPIMPHDLVFGTVYEHLSDALPRVFGYRSNLAEWHPYRSHPWGDPNAGRFGQTSAAHGSSPYCPRCGYGKVHTASNPRTHV